MQTTSCVLTDPAALTAAQWSARLAGLTSQGRGDTDPGVIACRRALAYWRCRRTIDAERDRLDPDHLAALAIETVPDIDEAEALVGLVRRLSDEDVWGAVDSHLFPHARQGLRGQPS